MALFSIIIPAYNAEEFISRAIKSVLNQSYEDFQLVIVNDGSVDDTEKVVKSFSDKRILLINQKNGGVSVARNTGIENSSGEYICFLDADDEYLHSHLEVLSNQIKAHPDNCFFATRFCMQLVSGQIVNPETTESVEFYKNVVEESLNRTEFLWTGCVCVKIDMFEKYGGFEPGVKLGEDTDMWRRIFVHTGVVYIDTVTVKRNRDGSEATKTYVRRYDPDPLNRMPVFMSDSSISKDIKNSLKKEYEWTKLQVVRSYLLDGDKKTAMRRMREIDGSRIPLKRKLVTWVCFFLPTMLLRRTIEYKNKGMYKESGRVKIG